jgi:chitinase
MRSWSKSRRWSAVGLAVATLSSGIVLATAAPASAAALPDGFRSVGYMPSWSGDVNAIQYDKLSHINYAFALPNPDGTLQAIEGADKLSALVDLGHQNNVKVSLAIGGWNDGDDSAFESLAGSEGGRSTFVDSVMGVIDQYGLDGVDIDWEYPDPGASGDNFTLLMQQLAEALHGNGKLLTAAVVSGGGTAEGVQPAVFEAVDWLNIMAYDGGEPHANYDWSIESAEGWKARGLPAEKTVLGVPFYSRPGYLTYAQLVAMDPANAEKDCVDANGAQQCYNGIPTIKRKTEWALANAGGIMNWELSQDTADGTSLVSAIFEAAGGA